MSVLIKSDNAYTGVGSIPLPVQTATNPQAVIDAYIDRVVTDGGTIISHDKITNAVNFMFRENLYGRVGVSASPFYGVKLNPDGGILKLYSIDGDDLVGLSLNGGDLPKIVGNFVDFNEGQPSDDVGGILTTETAKAHTTARRLSIAMAVKDIANTVETQTAGFTVHDSGIVNNYSIFGFATSPTTTGTVVGLVSKNYGTGLSRNTFPRISQGKAVLASYDKIKKNQRLYQGGALGLNYQDIVADERVFSNAHYVDFGGAWRSGSKVISGVRVSAMWFMANANDAQNLAVNAFMQSEYY